MITPDLYKTLLVKDENIGFTLFEKPKLDLSEEFCRADSILSSLLCFDPQSKEFALRYNLDRSLIDDERLSKLASLSPQLEEKSPFNTLMSNTLIGASGWPSLEGEEKTVKGRSYDLTFSFSGRDEGFVAFLFYCWVHYLTLKTDGGHGFSPNDTCSIYRVTMDPSGRSISRWAKASGCFPVSAYIGPLFELGKTKVSSFTPKPFDIPFKAQQIEYMKADDLVFLQRYVGKVPEF